jgi:predicted ester cyclase
LFRCLGRTPEPCQSRHGPGRDHHLTSTDPETTSFLDAFTAAFPDNVQTPTHIACEDDLIGIYATYEGTHLGPFGGFEPTGKRAKFDFAGMMRVADGKLSEWWITWDTMTILAQLGLLPDTDSADA